MGKQISLYLVVPALTIAVASILLVWQGTPKELIAARVFGGPTETQSPLAIRIVCVRRAVGVEDQIPLVNGELQLQNQTITFSCNQQGIAEIVVDSFHPSNHTTLSVTHQGILLAQGTVSISREVWSSKRVKKLFMIPTTGSNQANLGVWSGTMPVGKWSLLHIKTDSKTIALRDISAAGADVSQATQTPKGWMLPIRPAFHHVVFDASLLQDGKLVGHINAQLPITSGGIFIENIKFESDRFRAIARSMTTKAWVHFRVEDETGRKFAGIVAMKEDSQGGSIAEIIGPLQPHGRLVVSTDGFSTFLGVPLEPETIEADGGYTPDVLWLDGMSPKIQEETKRINTINQQAILVVFTGALLELILLTQKFFTIKEETEQQLKQACSQGATPLPSSKSITSLRILIAIAIIIFGFSVLAALLVSRI